MPYQWLPPSPEGRHLRLWPHRSLPRTGFVWFIGATATLISLPLLAVLGTPVLWGLLPFLGLALAGVWWAIQRNWRDGEIVEDLLLTPERMTLTRLGPRGRRQDWEANPFWVRAVLHPRRGPVPNYITLQGGPREVELGAFLSEDERLALLEELRAALGRLR